MPNPPFRPRLLLPPAVILSLFLFILLVPLLQPVALAAQGPAVELELLSYKVVTTTNEQGEPIEELQPAGEVAPGDVLEWRLIARNATPNTLTNVVLVIPIPPETYYLEGTASVLVLPRSQEGSDKDAQEEGGTIVVRPEFSYDGGEHFAPPPLLKEVIEIVDGKKVVKQVPVPPEEYTHVRWVVPVMQPEQVIEVYLRTKVR